MATLSSHVIAATPALLAAALLLGGCAQEPEPLRLYAFDGGRMRLNDVRIFSPPYPDTVRPVTIGNPAFLVVHPEGTLLWDAGFSDRYVGGPSERRELALGTILMDRTLEDQLADVGYGVDEIDYVAPSHMHTDHAGNLDKLTAATCLLQAAEYEAAFESPDPTHFHFDPADYDAYPAARVEVIPETYDVFGDWRVVIHAAPGHSPGHQVLLLRLAETGNVVLSGDLYHLQYNRDHRVNPSVQYDTAASYRSMEKIDALLAANDATLWIQHEPALSDTLRMAPLYYE